MFPLVEGGFNIFYTRTVSIIEKSASHARVAYPERTREEYQLNIRAASWRVTILLIGGICVSALQVGESMAAEDTGMRSGPAAWIEEYWDVKPEKFDEFLKAYKRDVYSISRRIPGYRGYTFLTNIPDADGNPKSRRKPDRMITEHYGVHLQGKILTERAIDIGNLLMRTHNVVVVHHLQSWADAQTFRQSMERIYVDEHHGENYPDHLAKTLYPLANNYWETSFRLIETGLPMTAEMRSGGKDADGFNLEPRPSNEGWFKEYFEVNAEDLDAFLNAYKNNTLVVMKPIPGYQGVTIVTTLPPSPAEATRTQYTGQILGGPSQFYVPQPGVMMDGTIRTDTSVNYSLLFKPTFTIITYYQYPWDASRMLELMQKNFEIDYPGQDRIKHITKVFFPHIQNHWDMHYRAIETSFVPSSATAVGGK